MSAVREELLAAQVMVKEIKAEATSLKDAELDVLRRKQTFAELRARRALQDLEEVFAVDRQLIEIEHRHKSLEADVAALSGLVAAMEGDVRALREV